MVINMSSVVSKSQFKAKALEYFRQVQANGECIVVTDHGMPAIEVRKYHHIEDSPLDALKGSVLEYTEPTEPVADSDWEALL